MASRYSSVDSSKCVWPGMWLLTFATRHAFPGFRRAYRRRPRVPTWSPGSQSSRAPHCGRSGEGSLGRTAGRRVRIRARATWRRAPGRPRRPCRRRHGRRAPRSGCGDPAATTPRQPVRGRAELERCTASHEQVDDRVILERAYPVADPFRTQHLDGVAHACSTGRFAGVGDRSKPMSACEVKWPYIVLRPGTSTHRRQARPRRRRGPTRLAGPPSRPSRRRVRHRSSASNRR